MPSSALGGIVMHECRKVRLCALKARSLQGCSCACVWRCLSCAEVSVQTVQNVGCSHRICSTLTLTQVLEL